jgi:hypothetical protein
MRCDPHAFSNPALAVALSIAALSMVALVAVSVASAQPTVIVVTPPASAPVPPAPSTTTPAAQRRQTEDPHRGEYSLIASGAGAFVVGWIASMIVGGLAGWHGPSRTCHYEPPPPTGCSIGGCPSGSTVCDWTPSSYDPQWGDFRTYAFVPLVGPILQAEHEPAGNDSWPGWLVVDSVVQFAGLTALIVGVVLRVQHPSSSTPSVALLPSLTPSSTGLVLAGVF